MEISGLKRKCMVISVVLVIIGAIITAVGMGMADFDMTKLETHKWYQTFHFDA